MKTYYYLLPIIVLIGCQEDQDYSNVTSKEVQVINGRLAFQDLDHFLETVLSIQQNRTKIVNGRLLDLEYDSYYTSLAEPKLISENSFEVLDLYEFRILLNEYREVEIAKRIYVISNENAKVYDLNDQLVEVIENEIGYYNKTTKSFDVLKDRSNGKQFGLPYVEWILQYNPPGVSSLIYGIRYYWLRSSVIGLRLYYYDATFIHNGTPETISYFRREISDCATCNISPNNPYGGTTYNVSHVRYACGGNTIPNEQAYGAWLRAVYNIKPYSNFEKQIYHQDDLDIP